MRPARLPDFRQQAENETFWGKVRWNVLFFKILFLRFYCDEFRVCVVLPKIQIKLLLFPLPHFIFSSTIKWMLIICCIVGWKSTTKDGRKNIVIYEKVLGEKKRMSICSIILQDIDWWKNKPESISNRCTK